MKTKQIILLTLLHFLNVSITAQNIQDGVYSNENKFVCVNSDTIIHYDGMFWYKGTFEIKNNKMYFLNNELLGKNAIITKEKCSPDSIELRLITKHKHYLIGMPSNDTNIYEYESNIYAMHINKIPLISRDTNGIYISKGQFSDEVISNGFLLDDPSAGFVDYFTFPLEYGTRYIVKQKYHGFAPAIINNNETPPFVFLYDIKHNRILIKEDLKDKRSAVYEYKNAQCDSCFSEFKNRFPLLFE